ncbi:hypothetical protein CRBSH125_06420 [Afipia carboxidovorans]|nr:hypothetical protein CRBSH125_06420 [Afipia carboxidovorans]
MRGLGARVGRACLPVVLAGMLLGAPAHAQFPGDNPAPVPPASIPEAEPSSPAISLAPPSALPVPPDLPAQLVQPPLIPPPSAQAAPQGSLALSARFGKDLPVINGGLVWRIYSDKPSLNGAMQLVREEHAAGPTIPLPPGGYVVHASLGLVSDVHSLTVKQDETARETFELPAGGLRIEGRVGTSKIPQGQIVFSVYKGSQFEIGTGDRAPIAQNIPAGDVLMLPAGIYYLVSNYGDANSIVRSDIRVQAAKLTDVVVTHRAAVITLKLVGEKGGEALANTSWSVITPAGDVIKESTGAFPRVMLAEGEYRAIAKNEGKVFERDFEVKNGVDGEVEVLTR